MSPLTDRQERFVHEYLIDQNAAAAARRAGYSESTRGSQAAALMKMPAVRERIHEELQALFARLRVNAYTLMQAQSRIAFFDPAKLFDDEGNPRPLSELDEDTAAVLNVSYHARGRQELVRRVRQPARQSALNALDRRYAQFMRMQLELLQAQADAPEAAGAEADEARESEPQTVFTRPVASTAAPIKPRKPRPAQTPPSAPYARNPRLGAAHVPQPPQDRFAPAPLGPAGGARRGCAVAPGAARPGFGRPGAGCLSDFYCDLLWPARNEVP
jgi:phage terminase small subunit